MARIKKQIPLPGKIMAFDLETTGLDPEINGIHQLSCMFFVDGVFKTKHNFHIAPFVDDVIDSIALNMSGKSEEEIRGQQNPMGFFSEFQELLKHYVNPFDRNDQLIMLGYNVNFDINFLRGFFLKNNNRYFMSYFSQCYIDVLQMVYILKAFGHLSLKSYKLKTVCGHFDIEINAHDAMSDIQATVKLYNIIHPLLQKVF